MTCEINSNIHGFAALSSGEGAQTMLKAVRSAKEVEILLRDRGNLTGHPDRTAVIKDSNQLVSALKGIPTWKEHGMVVMQGNSEISTAGNRFLASVATTNKHTVALAMDKLELSGEFYTDRVATSDGKSISTEFTVEELNAAARKRFKVSNLNAENTTYFAKKGKKVVALKAFTQSHNNHQYYLYQKDLSALANQAIFDTKKAPNEFNEGVVELNSGPVLKDINTQIYQIYKQLEAGKIDGTLTGTMETEFEKSLRDLTLLKDQYAVDMTTDELLTYMTSVLEGVKSELRGKTTFNSAELNKFTSALALVNNAASYKEDNLILDEKEILKNANLMKELNKLRDEADSIQTVLNQKIHSTVLDIMKDNRIEVRDLKKVFEIGGLNSGVRRFFAGVLGTHQIDNDVVQYLGKVIQTIEVTANRRARDLNEELDDLLKEAKKNGFDEGMLYQRRADGTLTGRMIDSHSHFYWSEKEDIMYSRDRRELTMIEMNPAILFAEGESDKKTALHAELLDQLGERLYKRYIGDSKEAYRKYLNAKKQFQSENDSLVDFLAWDEANSPIERVDFLERGEMGSGSDRYLVTAPRRINTNGDATNFFDATFDTLLAHETGFAFYKEARLAHIRQQEQLHKFEEKYKPPKLGFVNKGMMELIKAGRYSDALAVSQSAALGIAKETFREREASVDSLGNVESFVKGGLNSIPNEIRREARPILEANEQFQLMMEAGPRGMGVDVDEFKEMIRGFREEAIIEASKIVEKNQSANFMQSLALANYDTELLIEKKKAEADILLVTREFDKSAHGGGKNTEANMAKVQKVKAIIAYTLNKKYYNIADEEAPFLLNPIKSEFRDKMVKGEKELDKMNAFLEEWGVEPIDAEEFENITASSDKKILGSGQKMLRSTVLGWSVPNGVRNLFQAFFSNSFKAIEGIHYGGRDLMYGYRKVGTHKTRTLMDYLYILGDVAYDFDQKSIHEDASWIKYLKPMTVQTEVEKINQGAVMVAIMNKIKLVDADGNESSLYDAIESNGVLDRKWTYPEMEGLTGSELVSEIVVAKIRPANKEASGDYLSPLLFEKSAYGKMGSMFTKYLFDMHMDRWGGREFDRVQGREKEGRYISVLKKLSHHLMNGTWHGIDKDSDMGKKLRSFSSNDEITIAGVRTAIAEVITIITMMVGINMLRKAWCEEDDCEGEAWAAVAAMNTMDMLSSDLISVAFSPATIIQKTSSPFALASTVQKFADLSYNLSTWALGTSGAYYQEDTDFYESGDPKFYRNFAELFPGYNNIVHRHRKLGHSMYVSDWQRDLDFFED